MARLILHRLLLAIPVMIGILLVAFLVLEKGIEDLRPDDVEAGSNLPPEMLEERIAAFRRHHHLDEPLLSRFLDWTRRAVVLDLGESVREPVPVTTKLAEALGPTLLLQGSALALAVLLGLPFGMFLARRRGRLVERLGTSLLSGLIALPGFWVATLLIAFLATDAGFAILPLEGLASRDADELGPFAAFADRVRHLVLPVTALALPLFAITARFVRAAFLDALSSGWTRTLRAVGVGERRILWRYAMRSALPLLSAQLGLALPDLVAGSIVIERIFAIPGTGTLLWNATFSRDFAVLQGLILLTAATVLIAFLVADLIRLAYAPERAAE